MAITKVCIYTRISTDEENQPTSLHSQRERLEAFCKAQEGWRIVAHKQDQATGTKLDRPGLQAALDLARSGSIDMLLVYRVDRLSRKVRQLAQLTEELDALDVVLKSATEPFDTGAAAGRMMLQMLAVFAEFEHATIVDRISAGIERRAKEGRWFGGRPPFGYTFSSEERMLVPDPVKAPVVRRVFDLYARKRLGTRTIAQQLRDEGAPAPSAGWGHPAVHWIINNPTYVGKIRWRDKVFDGVHEPLVDEFTFAKAQAIMRERGDHAKRRGNASDFVLSGLLRCGKCGKAYIGMSANGNGGRYHYYACTGRQKYGPKACDGERLPRDKVEQAVLHQLISLYRDEKLTGDALTKANAVAEKQRPEFEQRLASIGAEIARAEQSLERYYEAFEQGKLSPERCEDRLTRLQTRLDDLHAQQAELELEAPHVANNAPTAADVAEVADLLEGVIADGNPQKTKPLLNLLIDELRVSSRAEILPTYRLVTPAVCAMSEKVARLFPVVTVLVDGDVLGGSHRHLPFIGFPPSSILGADSPLLPTAEGRRVAFYRCDCGFAECNVLAAVIAERGGQVVWSALRAFSSWGSGGPLADRNVGPGAQLWLPGYVFDASQYREEIQRASTDESFETPERLNLDPPFEFVMPA